MPPILLGFGVDADATPPVIAPAVDNDGANQLYVVPFGITLPNTVDDGEILNVESLHSVWVILEITGLGLTVTVTANVLPTQLPAAPDIGVIVYVAVCAVFVAFINVPVIELPLPEAPPVIPPVTAGAIQL